MGATTIRFGARRALGNLRERRDPSGADICGASASLMVAEVQVVRQIPLRWGSVEEFDVFFVSTTLLSVRLLENREFAL
jgi:hypothetical protein